MDCSQPRSPRSASGSVRGAHDAAAKGRCVLEGQQLDLAADELGARVVSSTGGRRGDRCARCGRRPLDELLPCPSRSTSETVSDAEGDLAVAVKAELRSPALGDCAGLVVGDGQHDRDRPGPGLAVALDGRPSSSTVRLVRLAHGPGQGTEGAVGDAVEGRLVDLVHLDLRPGEPAPAAGAGAHDAGRSGFGTRPPWTASRWRWWRWQKGGCGRSWGGEESVGSRKLGVPECGYR